MKKAVWVTSLIMLFSVLILPAIASLVLRELPVNVQPPSDFTQKIYQQMTVTQPVTCTVDNLSVIGVSIRNLNLLNKEDLVMLISDLQGNVLRKTIINGAVIKDGAFIKFRFEPLPESKNRKYLLTFASPASVEPTAFEIFLTRSSRDWMENITINDKVDYRLPASAALVAFYKPTNIYSQIGGIYYGWLSRLSADTPFFVVYLLVMVAGAGYLLWPLNFNWFSRFRPGR